MTEIASRKADHIDLCATGDVGFHAKTTLFGDVELVHDALPELSLDGIDTSVTLFGKKLRAPLLIASMTGGTDRARDINRELARIAEERGYGFGLGSQRAMLRAEEAAVTYAVREAAPTALVLANLGAVQARDLPTADVEALVQKVGADALCLHLNPAQEIVQPGGDRDFRGCTDALARLTAELGVPVIAKETGAGIGPRAAARLARAGVRHVDVSGAGGTSWVAVETQRTPEEGRALGEALREWGVPTAAAVAFARRARPRVKPIIAPGGVASGAAVAKAIALGAHAAGIARPVLKALTSGGREGALRFLAEVEAELRAVMLLVGAATVADLRRADLVTSGVFARWMKLSKG